MSEMGQSILDDKLSRYMDSIKKKKDIWIDLTNF